MTVKQFIDKYALALSMLVGAAGFAVFRHLTPVLPPMIGLMLFFTFCKVNPLDLRLHSWHWAVLAVQMALTAGTFYGCVALCRQLGVNQEDTAIISQGLMVCFIMPTATAAPIIAGKLGGSIQNLTAFTLLSNAVTAIVVPAFFPLVHPDGQMAFLAEMWLILRRVAPLLLLPLLGFVVAGVGASLAVRRLATTQRLGQTVCPDAYLGTGAVLPLDRYAGHPDGRYNLHASACAIQLVGVGSVVCRLVGGLPGAIFYRSMDWLSSACAQQGQRL